MMEISESLVQAMKSLPPDATIIPDDPASRFLDYYGQYLIAKRQNEAEAIWSNAVACRKELQKTGDPGKEAQFCEMIFEGFVSREKAAKI
jgi:hypothetical protein